MKLPLTILLLTLTPLLHAADLLPAPDATNIPPDTQLHLTFPTPPTLTHKGKIQILDTTTNTHIETIDTAAPIATQTIGTIPNYNYYPITLNANEAVIHPKNGALTYNQTYTIQIDPGVFSPDPATTTWKFTTQPAAPTPTNHTITIAADDSSDFATVQGAIDSLPDNNLTPTTLLLKKGLYTELVVILNKHNLTLKGEDRKHSIIAYPDNDRFNNDSANHTYHRGMLLAHHCDNLTLTNLTLHNTTPQGGSQAEAIILNGSPTAHAVLDSVDLYSFQDTLQINGQAYIVNSYIEGDVDFMWGTGPCFFENCECKGLRSKAYFTQIRNIDANHGYIYYHCTFDTAPNVSDLFLSRIEPTRFPHSEVALIDCTLVDHAVSPIAWKLDPAKGTKPTTTQQAEAAANVHFWEYHSHTPDGTPIDTTQRLPISKQLTQPQDTETITNYSNPTYILGNNWNPRDSHPTTQPAN
jgi:pectin methylesterase-like acyl-CoA thioesterase